MYLRFLSRNISTKCRSVIYSEHGDPAQVLKIVETELPEPKSTEVLIKMLASSINPADINMIQGIYPVRPMLPAVGGNEGLAKVIQIGSKIKSYAIEDFVIINSARLGTWRTHAITTPEYLYKIPNDLPLTSAATLSVNPTTAYRMLKDFEVLSDDDVIIQNGANSAVGQAVIQIAAELKFKTINIVRNRPDIDSLVIKLTQLGATHVITDEFLRSSEMKSLFSDLPKPKLGLNTVGGKCVVDMLKYICPGGTVVTYGGMSKQPVMVPTGSLIFNDIKIRGYWNTRWKNEFGNSVKNEEMISFLINMVYKEKLKPPFANLVPIENFKEAIIKSMQPFITEKQILIMND